MGIFNKKIKKNDKVKKQVIINPDLYRQMKARMILKGISFSHWLEEKMKEEISNG